MAITLFYDTVSQITDVNRHFSRKNDLKPQAGGQQGAAAGVSAAAAGASAAAAGVAACGGPAVLEQWLQQAAAVQAALLVTEINGLYWSVRRALKAAASRWDECTMDALQEQQQQNRQHTQQQQEQEEADVTSVQEAADSYRQQQTSFVQAEITAQVHVCVCMLCV